MHPCLETLQKGQNPGPELITEYLNLIMTGEVSHEDTVAFLLGMNKVTPSTPEIAACVRVMRANAAQTEQDLGSYRKVDTCGTGGDNSQTINISTLAAIGLAALELDKVLVTKHGNKAVSSPSGSADLLGSLGVQLDLPNAKVVEHLLELGMSFLFAPAWHPAMKYVMPARKEIGTHTIFNILGPLSNPLAPEYQLAGVFAPELLDTYAGTFAELGLKSAMVVHGVTSKGQPLDECAPDGRTQMRVIRNGTVSESTEIGPSDFGLPNHDLSTITVTSADDALNRARQVLAGEEGPALDVIAMQGALLLQMLDEEPDPKKGAVRFQEVFTSGAAGRLVDRWQNLS